MKKRVASVSVLLYQQLLQYLYFCTNQPGEEGQSALALQTSAWQETA
jgi:hypothetical protein